MSRREDLRGDKTTLAGLTALGPACDDGDEEKRPIDGSRCTIDLRNAMSMLLRVSAMTRRQWLARSIAAGSAGLLQEGRCAPVSRASGIPSQLGDIPIADYGLIGDMRTTALVGRDGRIDWLCLPHHDSPAVFLRLLDPAGGFCNVDIESVVRTTRRYPPRTNVLETTFETATGTLVLLDFMHVRANGDSDSDASGALVRLARCVRGRVRGRIVTHPTFDDLREPATISAEGRFAALFSAPSSRLRVLSSHALHASATSVAAAFDLAAGDAAHLMLGIDMEPGATAEDLLHETCSYWERWASKCNHTGMFADQVLRSVLCLKLLTYAPTGAIVAAPTLGLPEAPGGPRNWDYRYAWIRDASFCVEAFVNLGFLPEAGALLRFFREAHRRGNGDLHVLYSIDNSQIPNETLDHLRGYAASRPVRVGNDAEKQVQHDIYGELSSALRLYLEATGYDAADPLMDGLPELVESLGNKTEEVWQQPDSGIWEFRGKPSQYFHSKALCWVALDSCVRMGLRLGLNDTVLDRWKGLKDVIWREYHDRCWDETEQAYVSGYAVRSLDAAVMRCTLFGANDPRDEKLSKTLSAIERDLGHGPQIYRYRMPDGLSGNEGAFFACSFWLAGNWVLQGQTRKALERTTELIGCGNDLGLFSEEVDPETGAFLGNFPQAFTHMALINGVLRLQKAIDHVGLK